ncbi:MAG: hypothetical protein V1944_02730 [Candidatus Aenigmatarchaeota archaeon]
MELELDNRKLNKNSSKAIKLRSLIHKLAYGSLILDILIAIITTMSLLQISAPGDLLVPVNILLTIVVILSIGSGILVVFLEHYEKILMRTLNIKERIKDRISRLVELRNRYRYSHR